MSSFFFLVFFSPVAAWRATGSNNERNKRASRALGGFSNSRQQARAEQIQRLTTGAGATRANEFKPLGMEGLVKWHEKC